MRLCRYEGWVVVMYVHELCHLLMHNNLTGYITLTIDTGN